MIGQMFIHRHIGTQPGHCGIRRLLCHLFGGPPALAKPGENPGDLFRLHFQQQHVSQAGRVGYRLHAAFLLTPAEVLLDTGEFTVGHLPGNA